MSTKFAQNIEQMNHAPSGRGTHISPRPQPIQPGGSLPGFNSAMGNQTQSNGLAGSMNPRISASFDKPMYFSLDSAGAQPTWRTLLPVPPVARKAPPSNGSRRRYFRLSLLNVNEFTITGLQPSWDAPPTPLTNLRTPIRQTSREHGKAVFERD